MTLRLISKRVLNVSSQCSLIGDEWSTARQCFFFYVSGYMLILNLCKGAQGPHVTLIPRSTHPVCLLTYIIVYNKCRTETVRSFLEVFKEKQVWKVLEWWREHIPVGRARAQARVRALAGRRPRAPQNSRNILLRGKALCTNKVTHQEETKDTRRPGAARVASDHCRGL